MSSVPSQLAPPSLLPVTPLSSPLAPSSSIPPFPSSSSTMSPTALNSVASDASSLGHSVPSAAVRSASSPTLVSSPPSSALSSPTALGLLPSSLLPGSTPPSGAHPLGSPLSPHQLSASPPLSLSAPSFHPSLSAVPSSSPLSHPPSAPSASSPSLGPLLSAPASPGDAAPSATKTATVIPINDSTVSAAAMLMSIAATTSASSTSASPSSSSSSPSSSPSAPSSFSASLSSSSPSLLSSSSSASSGSSVPRSSLMSSLSNPVPKPKPLPPVSALERFVHYLHPLLQTHPGSVAPSITLPQLRVIAQTNFHQLIALSLSVHFNPRRPYPGHQGKEEKLIICKNGWNALRNYVSGEREKVWRAEMMGLSVREQRMYKKRRKDEKKVANAAIREGRMAKFIDIANEYAINYAAFVKLGDEHSGRLRFRQIKKEQKDAAANALVNSSALISASNVNAAISSVLPPPRLPSAYTLAHVVDEQQQQQHAAAAAGMSSVGDAASLSSSSPVPGSYGGVWPLGTTSSSLSSSSSSSSPTSSAVPAEIHDAGSAQNGGAEEHREVDTLSAPLKRPWLASGADADGGDGASAKKAKVDIGDFNGPPCTLLPMDWTGTSIGSVTGTGVLSPPVVANGNGATIK